MQGHLEAMAETVEDLNYRCVSAMVENVQLQRDLASCRNFKGSTQCDTDPCIQCYSGGSGSSMMMLPSNQPEQLYLVSS